VIDCCRALLRLLLMPLLRLPLPSNRRLPLC